MYVEVILRSHGIVVPNRILLIPLETQGGAVCQCVISQLLICGLAGAPVRMPYALGCRALRCGNSSERVTWHAVHYPKVTGTGQRSPKHSHG